MADRPFKQTSWRRCLDLTPEGQAAGRWTTVTLCEPANSPEAKGPGSVYRSSNHCYFLLNKNSESTRAPHRPISTFLIVLQGNLMPKRWTFSKRVVGSSQMRNYRKDGHPWKIPCLQIPNVFIRQLKTGTPAGLNCFEALWYSRKSKAVGLATGD